MRILNRYERKLITKRKLKKLHDKSSYFVYETESPKGQKYYKRLYLSGSRKFAKRQTNRLVRKTKENICSKGCAYRRKFDYWYTIF